MKSAVILGGGFAGVQAAIELKKSGLFDVTLISDRNYLYIYPISIWVPVRKTKHEKVKLALSEIQKAYKFNLIIDEVTEILSSENKVYCSTRTIKYDYLIVAMGSGKMNHPGISNSLSICGNPDAALQIRDRLDSLVNKGEGKIAVGFGGNPLDKSAVRGGPAFEMMFNIHEMLEQKGIRKKFELTFFAPMPEPGERMGKKSVEMVNSMFDSLEIKKQYGKKIKSFEQDGVIFENDYKLQSDLTIFIPASAGHKVLTNSDLPLSEAGFIKIDNTCKTDGKENVFAAGDIAAIEGPGWIAKQGHIAELMARVSVNSIINLESGIENKKGYQKHLNIICVMDTGNGASFVYRDDKKAFVIPMPVVGHWMKMAWGIYTKLNKRGLFPRLPGL